MKRLTYLDMLRGFSILWLLVFQLLDMFSVYDLYGQFWFQLGFNWVAPFFIIAGFSCNLMLEKYSIRRFYLKVLRRLVFFVGIGFFLTFWCGFQAKSLFIFDREVVGAIGFNLAILSVFFSFAYKIKNDFLNATWFFSLSVIMFVLSQVIALDVIFNPFIMLFYMTFGAMLGFLKNTKLFIIAEYLEKIPFANVLAFFGRHSLFFYFFHYAIINKILLESNLLKTVNIIDGLILTLLSIFGLFCLFTLCNFFEKKREKDAQKRE